MSTKFSYIEAPKHINKLHDWQHTIFLGGSITGAYDWQKITADKLLPYFNVFNPRRQEYDMTDSSQEFVQISWEHTYLTLAQINLFYFDCATLAPITLLEYGALLEEAKITPYKKIYTCIHPEYKRKNDVYIQTQLRNPQFVKNIRYNLDETLDLIIKENA